MPSAAIVFDFLSAFARPALRMFSIANSMSPCASTNALLHSIMPEPVRSRNSFTIDALISIVIFLSRLLLFTVKTPPKGGVLVLLYLFSFPKGNAE